MKQFFRYFIILVFWGTTQTCYSQVVTPYQVGTWPGFRTCAISYTFDDGCSGQFTKAIPIFNEFEYKLTLFTISSWIKDWTGLKNAALSGHEVANHTDTHPNFTGMAVDKQEAELKTCNDLVNLNVANQQCLTMAYPYCAKGNDALHKKYFIAARGCQGAIEGKTPSDMMNVSSIICGALGSVKLVKDFKGKADLAANQKGWLVYLIHGIDNDTGYSPLSSDTLKASLRYLKDNDAKFWVNTFGSVARYVKERNCVTIKETLVGDTIISIAVTDTLKNNDWYNFPLTFRRTMPTGWTSATITQNGKPVNSLVVEVSSVKYLQFEAVPDGGSVVISKADATGLNDLNVSEKDRKLKVWIIGNSLLFTVPESCLPNPTLSLFSSNGILIDSFDHCTADGKIGKVTLKTLPKSGVFVVHLTDKKSSWSSQISIF
jgi:peptidoglycan/xylan/chitin deacetylase (PgdA/CDA1 family)